MSCGTPPLELSACLAFAATPSAECGLVFLVFYGFKMHEAFLMFLAL